MRAESAADSEKDEMRSYAEDHLGEEVVHVEKVGSELVGPQRHDIWDVHCADSRWWVLTNPTHYYSQEDFTSRGVALTFRVGLMIRMWSQQERRVPVAPEPAATLPGSWRRWQQAFEAYDGGDEAECRADGRGDLRQHHVPEALRRGGAERLRGGELGYDGLVSAVDPGRNRCRG